MRAAWLLGAIAGAVLVAGCEPTDISSSSDRPTRVVTPKGTPSTDYLCDEDIPFEPGYLPEGFNGEEITGRFPGGRPPDDLSSVGHRRKQQVIVHYRGSQGRAIEIRRPGTHFTELAQDNDAPTIEVLGTETSGFAPIGPGGDDFIVQFVYPAPAGPRQWCSQYSLNEHRVPLSELKKVAESLQVRSPDKPFRLLIHCGFSVPLQFRGRNWLPVDPRLRTTHNPPDGFGSDENYDLGTMRPLLQSSRRGASRALARIVRAQIS